MRLSERLKAIYELVPFSYTADIGADHGYLIIQLIKDDKIPYGLAVENKKGPFLHLEKEVEKAELKEKILLSYSSGIHELPDEVKTVVIAGMGGNTVIDILSCDTEKLKNVDDIIVDAHNAIPKVRKYVTSLGYFISDETIVYEDEIYYEIIRFHKGNCPSYQNDELFFGPILMKEKSPVFQRKYQQRIKEISHLLAASIPNKRKEELQKEKEKIEEIL